jgi:hypothetical protein
MKDLSEANKPMMKAIYLMVVDHNYFLQYLDPYTLVWNQYKENADQIEDDSDDKEEEIELGFKIMRHYTEKFRIGQEVILYGYTENRWYFNGLKGLILSDDSEENNLD